jgi:tetratricopeptide (TPR) repeat protein
MSALNGGQPLDSRFTLIRPLGQGGPGEVWLVRDEELGQELVAKILPATATEEQREQLRRECREARRLNHPNIVRVFDFHARGERAFVTMEHVAGDEIGRLRGGSPAEILRALVPLTDALAHAHALGVVHRDLKPANVVLDASNRPRLLDFGIAGRIAAREGESSVAGGGSRGHVGPQQLAGETPHPSDDLYALGVLIYELISGHPPFWPEITDERVREEEPAPMRSAWPLPDSLKALVSRLLAKTAHDRPAGMAEVMTELVSVLEQLDGRRAVELEPPPLIEPPPVAARTHPAPPDSTAPSPAPARRQRTVPPFLAGAAFGALALAAVFVFFVLPRWVADGAAEPSNGEVGAVALEPAVPQQEPPPSPAGDSFAAAARDRAEDELERLLELQSDLEEMGVRLWGGEAWEGAVLLADAGDDHLKQGAAAAAADAYAEAVARLEALRDAAADVKRRALDDGEAALERGEADAAQSAFTLAAEIEPGDPRAAAGLRRAESLEEVVALLDAGAVAERRGELVEAEQSYRRAAALDPAASSAREGLARIRARLADDAFAAGMSEGLEMLERGDYEAARAAFDRAEAVRPGTPQVADGLARLDQAATLGAIGEYRMRAEAFEADERWHAALEAYEAALGLDDNIGFAREGRDRTAVRARVADAIAFHLNHAERLSANEVYSEADRLLVDARALEPAGPRHRRQVEDLERLLAAAGTPVRVLLLSDELTDVVIYRVGRLGTFARRELDLRPGTYTVVGSRSGYRDVRSRLIVRAGADPEPVTIRCEEPI